MKIEYEQLLEMLIKCNRLHDLYFATGQLVLAEKYWAMGDRILQAMNNIVYGT